MGESKRLIASYYCRACDVEGRDYVDEDAPVKCWCCGGEPEVLYRCAETGTTGLMNIPLLYHPPVNPHGH